MSSEVSVSPSSLDSRSPSPAAVAQGCVDDSELEAGAGNAAGAEGRELELLVPAPGTLWKGHVFKKQQVE